MYQRDFILRMIEMLAELIAGILGLIKKGKIPDAEEALDKAYHDFLKEDAAFFNKIPADQLIPRLLSEHNYVMGHLEMLAELLFVEAELNFTKGKMEESKEFYKKSLLLNEYIMNEGGAFSISRSSRITLIHEKLTQIKGK